MDTEQRPVHLMKVDELRGPRLIWGFPQIRGTSLHNKDYNTLGSILGSPYLGKLPYLSEAAQAMMAMQGLDNSETCSV